MLRMLQLEEIHGKLLELPGVIDRYEREDPAFIDDAVGWLADIEGILVKNRLAIAGEVAALRGEVISARRRRQADRGEPISRSARRSSAASAAADALRTAIGIVSKRIEPDLGLVSKAEIAMYELVSIARQIGSLPADQGAGLTFARLQEYWDSLSASEYTAKYAALVRSLLGKAEATILLERVLAK
jgi:hypothetical protein